jgi:prepilin-type N-terminal cleavage/methylation domain-containing protein
MACRHPFTLIELLIVISVIGLLTGMLGPSLAGSLAKTRFARWKANNAQWNNDPDCVINFNFESEGYKVELSNGTKVDALYNSAEGCDAEGYDSRDYAGILINGPSWTSGRWKFKKALQFDGLNDYVIVPTARAVDFLPAKDEFTVCVWVYFDRLAFADCVFSKSQWGHSCQYTMYWYNSNMEIDAGQACVAYDQPKVKVGEWICFVYVNRVDTGYQLYFDGAPMRLSGSGSASSPTATPLGQFILGAAGIWQNRVGFHFRGKIDECLVFKRALSAAEIRGYYEMGKP